MIRIPAVVLDGIVQIPDVPAPYGMRCEGAEWLVYESPDEAPAPPQPDPDPAPESVPAWAAKAVLAEAGKLADAQAAVEALPGGAFRWAGATVWHRSEVLPMAAAIGLDQASADDLLRAAAAMAAA